MTTAFEDIQQGNSTDGGPTDDKLDMSTMDYFHTIFPVMMSMGYGGTAVAFCYHILARIRFKIWSKLYNSIHLKYSDDTFKWVNRYIKDMGFVVDTNGLVAGLKKEDEDPWYISIFKKKDPNEMPEIQYKPGPGIRKITHKGRTLWIKHSNGKTMILGHDRVPTTPQYIDITARGTDNAIIKDFIQTAIDHCMQKDNEAVEVYELHPWGLGWNLAQSKKPRPIQSVVLDSGLTNQIIDDITLFQKSPQWYKKKGVPYRRGYLLYGPPGTGKTSFTQAVAGALKLNICYLNLSGDTLCDDGLNRALNDAPQQSIILLEDIDGIFVEREDVNKNQNRRRRRRVTFAGLLNALDGVRS